MKTSACFVILMAAVTLLSANIPSEIDLVKCRDYFGNFKKDLSTVQLIEHDLVHGNWSTLSANGNQEKYYFNREGLLQVLHSGKDGQVTYHSTFWRVAEFDGQPFLVVSDDQRKEKLMQVDQTCEGITLRDVVSNEVFQLEYQPVRSTAKLNLTKAYMVGDWTNVSAMEVAERTPQVRGAFLQYQFSTDGTFSRHYGNHTKRIVEIGSWEISNDGQFLLLHIAEGDNMESARSTQVIRVAQVDDHGLVLEQVMKTSDVNDFFGADNKTYAFIR